MTRIDHGRYSGRKFTGSGRSGRCQGWAERSNQMRAIVSLVLMLSIMGSASAAVAFNPDPGLIVPGGRIGPARLGMSRAAIDMVNRTALCPVLAAYDVSGHAVRLETNWGGGCRIADQIQVGLPFGPVLRAFGNPDRVVVDTRYRHAMGVWMSYQARGVAFRVLGWSSGTTIQTIAVFPAIAY
jgi:hypothetical protein